jgi:octaprenyl-diphosphate synthase
MQLPAHIDIQGGVSAFSHINDRLQQVKESINEQLSCHFAETGEGRLVKYLESSSGKMIRPGLVLLAGGVAGEITDEHIRVAAIMEMIHNATLLHDDVIDQGQKRRGRATVNSLWGNESAVLLGDFLLSRVFGMCADLAPEVVNIIAAAAGRTCEGELRQIAQRENLRLSEAEYIDIVTEKTAALFSGCCYLGGFLSGAGEIDTRHLSDFGLNLGILFQITDDLLDLAGNRKKTRKTIGNDLGNGRVTLPIIHFLRAVNAADRKLVRRVLDMDEKRGWRARYNVLIKKLRACGSIDYARKRAGEFAGRAMAAIEDFGRSESKNALVELLQFTLQRAT